MREHGRTTQRWDDYPFHSMCPGAMIRDDICTGRSYHSSRHVDIAEVGGHVTSLSHVTHVT